MRNNMKLIMEKFDRFINEEMSAVERSLDALLKSDYNIYVESDSDYLNISIGTDDNDSELGRIEAQPLDNCSKVWYVSDVEAQQGWGPLLYDLAIAYCSINDREGNDRQGLTADKSASTTEAAFNVWKYYYNKRESIGKEQIKNICPDVQMTVRMRGAGRGGMSGQIMQPESEEYDILTTVYSMANAEFTLLDKVSDKIKEL